MIINNQPGRVIRPSSRDILVIDLSLSTAELGPLALWEIPEEYLSLSDHELIVLRWEDITYKLEKTNPGAITGWDIQDFIQDERGLKAAQNDWIAHTQDRPILSDSCSKQDLDEEVEWMEDLLTQILNTHSKAMRVTSFSKRWVE